MAWAFVSGSGLSVSRILRITLSASAEPIIVSLSGLDAHVIPQLPPSHLEGWRRSTAATWGVDEHEEFSEFHCQPCSTLRYCPLLVPF